MTQTLYSLRTEIDHDGAMRYRITKFVAGEVESSYHTSRDACECPAGVRPTCRHRQMLPHMLNADIANTHWFYDHDRGGAIVDFEGVPRSRYEFDAAQPPAPEGLLVPPAPAQPELPLEGEILPPIKLTVRTPLPRASWRRI